MASGGRVSPSAPSSSSHSPSSPSHSSSSHSSSAYFSACSASSSFRSRRLRHHRTRHSATTSTTNPAPATIAKNSTSVSPQMYSSSTTSGPVVNTVVSSASTSTRMLVRVPPTKELIAASSSPWGIARARATAGSASPSGTRMVLTKERSSTAFSRRPLGGACGSSTEILSSSTCTTCASPRRTAGAASTPASRSAKGPVITMALIAGTSTTTSLFCTHTGAST
mmetsp:Transcript_116415/g.267239  ORF Transcript_116415/g.267239 Transcript_116415/m.267239 type:complete len:224 (-) Transcript_116415:1401-2072(-)